ncbi:MAG: hypothetical protein IIY40_03535, partial [Firmicutes bacterium]|nr:hypothetical protein [Bacillota bacterium]
PCLANPPSSLRELGLAAQTAGLPAQAACFINISSAFSFVNSFFPFFLENIKQIVSEPKRLFHACSFLYYIIAYSANPTTIIPHGEIVRAINCVSVSINIHICKTYPHNVNLMWIKKVLLFSCRNYKVGILFSFGFLLGGHNAHRDYQSGQDL